MLGFKCRDSWAYSFNNNTDLYIIYIPTPHTQWEYFGSRMKRGVGFAQPIVVSCDAGCEFRDNVLTVAREGVWLQKFRNIQVFQVYNEMIGFQTFYGSAPQLFPGYGKLLAIIWPIIKDMYLNWSLLVVI